jgi:hypothetical protein
MKQLGGEVMSVIEFQNCVLSQTFTVNYKSSDSVQFNIQ